MTTIRLLANDQNLRVIAQPKIASGNIESVMLQVDFSKEWEAYTTSAVFFRENSQTVYEVLLTEGKCLIPHEVLEKPGAMMVGVRGVTPDAVKTTDLVKYWVAKGAPVGEGVSVDPTPDVYQQILARLNEMETITHSWDGTVLTVTSSSGTSSANLRGDPGEQGAQGPQGEKGDTGEQGPQGEAGYTPQKGIDYYTEADKQEMVTAVLAALPAWEGGSY